MSKQTTLASGQFTPSPDNTITVELLEPAAQPATVRVTWPSHTTITSPAKYGAVAAVAMRILASTEPLESERARGDRSNHNTAGALGHWSGAFPFLLLESFSSAAAAGLDLPAAASIINYLNRADLAPDTLMGIELHGILRRGVRQVDLIGGGSVVPGLPGSHLEVIEVEGTRGLTLDQEGAVVGWHLPPGANGVLQVLHLYR
jgi:hypothetical protein